LSEKKYVIWYNGGSGGFITAWLVQLCLEPDRLSEAQENFPTVLEHNQAAWQRYEKVPPDVGLLCNTLEPNLYYNIDNTQYAKSTIDRMIKGNSSVYDLFFCRSKYFLVNHVYQQGHTPTHRYGCVKKHLPDCTNVDFFKNLTDILFDVNKNIFVHAPAEYQRISQKIKQSRQIQFDVKTLATSYPELKIFETRTIWQGTYIQELEKVLERKISDQSQHACAILLDRYFKISPPELKNWCQTQWNT
jgi:hypothetical protein